MYQTLLHVACPRLEKKMDVRVLHLHAAAPQQNAIIEQESYKTCKAMTTRSGTALVWVKPTQQLKAKFWSKHPQNLLASTVYDLVCDCSTEIGPSKSQSQRWQIQLTQEVVE